MKTAALVAIILHYRYWILIPLTFIEGPIIAFVAGTLAATGYFNVLLLFALFFIRDMTLDGVCFALGYFGGNSRLARHLMRKARVTPHDLSHIGLMWEHHPLRTMFFAKISYGFAGIFIILAGMVRMRLSVFYIYAAIVTFFEYGVLIPLGYFFGGALDPVSNVLTYVQYVVGVAMLIVLIRFGISRFGNNHVGAHRR